MVFIQGGDSWILNPPGESPAFILADAGYDVWIGNARTTSFSYGHEYLTENDKVYICRNKTNTTFEPLDI